MFCDFRFVKILGRVSAIAACLLMASAAWAGTLHTLSPTGGSAAGDYFGQSIAVDGDTAVVGAPGANKAYVFEKQAGSWNQVAELTGSSGAAGLGFSAAISGDWIMLGNYSAYGAATNGAFWYQKPAGGWADMTETQQLTTGYTSYWGYSVSIDGLTSALGNWKSGVEIWTHDGSSWVYGDGPDGGAGGALSVSPRNFLALNCDLDGDSVIVGDFNVGGNGAAHVYDRGAGWHTTSTTDRTWLGADANWFGIDVALTGETALVGAYHENPTNNTGAAYVFDDWATSATPDHTLIGTDTTAGDNFGVGVDIDGNMAVVGSRANKVYLFEKGTNWSETAILSDPAGSGNYFGEFVAIDGITVGIGAHTTNGNAGAAYIYEVPEPSTLVLLAFAVLAFIGVVRGRKAR